jgi:hypothetical protein
MIGKKKALALAATALLGFGSMTVHADSLQSGQVLQANQPLPSHDGRYEAILQGDGNFVVYRMSDMKAIWNTGTVGSGATWAVMQTDGNFVIYTADGRAVWWTGTSHQEGSLPHQFIVDDEGMAAVITYVPVWITNTTVPNQPAAPALVFQYGFHFEQGKVYNGPNGNQWTFQTDGNLVLYHNGKAVWASNVTQAHGGKAIYADWEGILVTWNDSGYVWQGSDYRHWPDGFYQQAGDAYPLSLHGDSSYFTIEADGNGEEWIAARKWGAPDYDPPARNLPPPSGPHCIGDPRSDCQPGPVFGFPGSPPL